MSFQLSIQQRDGYLRFEISGARVPGEFARDMLGVWTQVAEECQSKGITRVLGVSHLTGPAPDNDIYAIGSKLPRMLVHAGCAMAAVVIIEPAALHANLFGEDVAVNRGLRVRIFSDEPSALTWLTT